MTAGPADSELGHPDPQQEPPSTWPRSPVGDQPHGHGSDESESGAPTEWVNTELHAIASTIEDLQSRLEAANSRLSSAQVVETTEFEMGRLFVEAQRFSEESLSKLELRIHEVLDAMEAKAQQILAEATQEAQEIRRRAHEAAFASTRIVQD